MIQPTLFDRPAEKQIEAAHLVLYALGEFQARGKELAERELPLDRLLGAFRRAAEVYEVDLLSDETLAKELETLGASVRRVPIFVAKHPFKITVGKDLAEQATQFYQAVTIRQNEVEQGSTE